MRFESPYCQWCRNRPGGCVYCGPKAPVPETRREEHVTAMLLDEMVVGVREVRVTEMWRMPKPHPDRMLCEPDERLERLLENRTQLERGVALRKFDGEWAKRQVKGWRVPGLNAKTQRRKEPKISPKD